MKKILSILSNFILLSLGFYAIHDMQTAQGVGYYFCLKAGSYNRTLYDVCADAVFVMLFVICLLIPMFLCKKKAPGAFSRFTILFVAFIPTIRPDYVFGLFFDKTIFNLPFVPTSYIDRILSTFGVMVPFLILILGFLKAVKGINLKKRWLTFLMVALILVFPGILVPAFIQALFFVSAYLCIFVIFDALEESDSDFTLVYIFLYGVALLKLINVTAAWGI